MHSMRSLVLRKVNESDAKALMTRPANASSKERRVLDIGQPILIRSRHLFPDGHEAWLPAYVIDFTYTTAGEIANNYRALFQTVDGKIWSKKVYSRDDIKLVEDEVKPGILSSTFHFPEIMLNNITSDEHCSEAMCPEYKVVACRIRKAKNSGARKKGEIVTK